jgi:hypothetical protein
MPLGHGICYYWRFKGELTYRFGYCTHLKGELYRMGSYNGDTSGGLIANESEIEAQKA